ncbi:hypothetical protein [Microbacterium sp. KNMS]
MTAAARSCPPDHGHAKTSTCYLHHRCRCADCRTEHANRAAERRRAIAYGEYTRAWVPAGPVRERVLQLIADGVGPVTIRRATGVNVDRLRFGAADRNGRRYELEKVAPYTARAILEYVPELDDYADYALVPATGTRRRLQALAAMGWSLQYVAAAIGHNARRITYTAEAERVRASTARLVRELYEWLSVAPPVARSAAEAAAIAHVKRDARSRGWVGPLAWDDIDNDPDLPVDEFETDEEQDLELDIAALLEQHAAGTPARLRGDELRRIVLALIERGEHSYGEIAELVGCASKTVERIRRADTTNDLKEAA